MAPSLRLRDSAFELLGAPRIHEDLFVSVLKFQAFPSVAVDHHALVVQNQEGSNFVWSWSFLVRLKI